MSITKVIQIVTKLGSTEKDLEKVEQGVQKIDKNVKKTTKSTGRFSKAIRGIGNALKKAGIGLAIALFAKMVEVFSRNQKVVDAFNIAMESLSIAFNDLFNFLDANVGVVIDYFKKIFNDPQTALKNLGNAIWDNLVERLNSALDMLGFLGEAVVKVFKGDFEGAMESAKNAGKEYLDVITGVDDSFDKVAETTKTVVGSITEYGKSTIKAAQDTVELNKQAEIAAVINQGLIEKYDRQAEQQRQLRDDETKTIAERIAANERLGEILDEQAEKMLENVDITIEAARREYEKSKNQEDYIALLEAQNEREAVLAQIEGFRSEQLINRVSLEREAAEMQKELDDAELERIEAKREAEAAYMAEKKAQIYENLDAIIDAAGQETKVGRALFILKQGLRIKEQIEEARATLQRITLRASEAAVDTAKGTAATAKVGFPQNIPLLIAFAAQAAGIISSIKAAVNAAKGSAASMGGSGGGGSISTPQVPSAPAFNVVGASPENQLAETISGQEQKPIKAFVVSNEVSNAQALDRNIIKGASIG